ncbi:MAG: outer membrane lipoprotein LolB [Burkholderiaceae bacterium]|nr:outer membrane lipoprotein LolB [Burkholderiaceae bacterium]MBT9500537.1 outer membrane lipoprotein LolB [Burkholderiaceae bacterium]
MARPLGLLLLCASIWGCATPPKPAAFAGDRLSGRLSVQVAHNSGGTAQGGAAAFELQGMPEAGQLELSTPLGTLAARASWQPGQALLQRSDTETRYADLDALTRDLLGEAVPVAALFDWLKGRPWTGAASHPLIDGKPGFRQLGWTVDLSSYAEGLINARRKEPTEVTLRARLDPPEPR